MARTRIFGGASAMNPPYRMAIKTGTSTHYRDPGRGLHSGIYPARVGG